MRILNFAKFSQCYLTIKEPRRIGYTDKSRLPCVAYARESGLIGVSIPASLNSPV